MTAAPATPAYAAPFALRFGLIVLMGLFSMGWYNFNRIATEGGVPFMGVAFYQCMGGAAFMALLLVVRRKGIPVSRHHLVFYAVSGLFGAAIPNTSVAFASPHLPVGVLSMGLAIEPAVTYLVALPLLLEKFRTIRFFGILVGIAGLMLILLPQAALPSPDMVPWVILGLGAPIGWSLWNNYIAFARARIRIRPPSSAGCSPAPRSCSSPPPPRRERCGGSTDRGARSGGRSPLLSC